MKRKAVNEKAMVDAIREILGMKPMYNKRNQLSYRDEQLVAAHQRLSDLDHARRLRHSTE